MLLSEIRLELAKSVAAVLSVVILSDQPIYTARLHSRVMDGVERPGAVRAHAVKGCGKSVGRRVQIRPGRRGAGNVSEDPSPLVGLKAAS
jgi:hypothetical protein